MVHYDDNTLEGRTDHTLLHLNLPVAVQPPPPGGSCVAPAAAVGYRWDMGSAISGTRDGITAWKEYSDTEEFKAGMLKIVTDASLSNEARSTAME